ncbi:hypothetical protein K503DRAFT_870885 [Rhizopogon vinicolor AM-OR11-026]|uniref:Uncharacterized protein n=1 Tax=Rhizopogon vinicolor AM-OR11-026 TaxID=1314800 RepID=A0A1B7MDU9_9AGAM|nr:hypothetical protein K503DRAFT_870885 [Rhizopogon vinicolor AM-OR11-026]
MTTTSDECNDEIEDYGDLEDFSAKRSKRLLTSFTCKRTPETSVYLAQRMLELSCVSRRTFAAQMKYQRLRTK